MTTILIADDHAASRALLALLLGAEGTTLLQARDGREALELARAQRPDLVITEILMPHMSGVELVQRLRSEARLGDVPVIFYTATYRESEARVLAAACGVKWVLGKPAEPERILAVAGTALGRELHTGRRPPVVPAAAADAGAFGSVQAGLAEQLERIEIAHAALSGVIDRGGRLPQDRGRLREMAAEMAQPLHRLRAVSLRLTPVIEIGIAMAAERDPQRLVERLCEAAHNLSVCRYAVVGIVDEAQRGLRLACARGLPEALPDWLREAPARSGVLALALDERLPQRFAGLPGPAQVLDLPRGHPPVHSLLAVPLATAASAFGWLYMVDKLGADGFAEEEEQIAQTLAAQCTVAYETLRVIAELRRLDQVLASRLEERTAQQQAVNGDATVASDLQSPRRTNFQGAL